MFWRNQFCVAVVFVFLMGALPFNLIVTDTFASGSDSVKNSTPPDKKQLDKPFQFGLWGISEMRYRNYFSPLDIRFGGHLGAQATLGHLRRNYCNAVLNPGGGPVAPEENAMFRVLLAKKDVNGSYPEFLDELLGIAKRYDMYLGPMANDVVPMGIEYRETKLKKYMAPVLEHFSREERILGWYLADEPPVSWTNNFAQAGKFINARNSQQPAFTLSCSREQLRAYAPLNRIIVTDCYPVMTPVFRKGKFLKRDPWDVADWCKDIDQIAPDKLHYLVLSCHDFWSNALPTPAELRLQTFLGLANGADGLFYFMYSPPPYWLFKYIKNGLVDPYGNPSELWEEVGLLGKRITPIGKMLMMSKSVDLPSLEMSEIQEIDTVSGSMPRVEGKVRRNPAGITLVYLWNNDVQYQQAASVSVKGAGGLVIYDLFTLEKIGPADVKHRIFLDAGDGKIFAVCTPSEFASIKTDVLVGRVENELYRLKAELDVAKLNKIACTHLEDQMESVWRSLSNLEPKNLPTLIFDVKELQKQLTSTCGKDTSYSSAQSQVERARRNLGQMHRILSEKLDATRAPVGLELPNPFPVIKQPGRSYAECGLLLSLAFKELSYRESGGQTRQLKIQAKLIADVTEEFVVQCKRELIKHRPAQAQMNEEKRKVLLAMIPDWQWKLLWLEEGNGIKQAMQKKKAQLKTNHDRMP